MRHEATDRRRALVFAVVERARLTQGDSAWPEHLGDFVIVHAGGTSPPELFVQTAAELMAADPRVASVSWADSAISALALGPSLVESALPTHPQVVHASAPAGQAVAFSASAVTLVGRPVGRGAPFDDLAVAVAAWSSAASARGLRHVWWASGARHEGPALVPTSESDRIEASEPLSSLAGLVDAHIAAHGSLRIGVDASRLGPHESGTQVAMVAWIRALLSRSDVASVALFNVPGDRLPAYAAGLDASPRCSVVPSNGPWPDVDVWWRPSQPAADALISLDRQHGRRLAVTVLDLIEFANARYHPDLLTWHRRRAQVRRYLRQADVVTVISDDVMIQVSAEVPGLAPERLLHTVLGVDAADPAGLEALEATRGPLAVLRLGVDRPFLLVLGNDFLHKNRDFAVRVWQLVCAEVPVDLVLAGQHVGRGSSRPFEKGLIAGRGGPDQPAVHVVGHVSNIERHWLTANAAVVLYPTSAEGFGLVPHEAARLGTPTVFTRFGPLAEFLPPDSGCATWDEVGYARETLRLLRDNQAAQVLCARILECSTDLTWQKAADDLMAAFRRSLALPPQPWGLWERAGGGGDLIGGTVDSSMAPMAPAEARRAAARIRFGRYWRPRLAATTARSWLGRLRRAPGR